jgi:hypothetical protein
MSGIGRFLFVVLRERENEEREEIDPFTREETREKELEISRGQGQFGQFTQLEIEKKRIVI